MPTEKKDLRPLSEITAEQIIEFITDNKMMPGDRLATEYELAERFSVGRSTVREAFKTLTSRNILEIRQGAGTFISAKRGISSDPLGLTFIYDNRRLAVDLLDVRLLFEPEMAAWAAIYATKEQCKHLEKQCSAVEDCIHKDLDHSNADIELHYLIAEASGNIVIRNLIPIIHSSVENSIKITNNALRENAIIYHRKIVDAIKSGDTQGAKFSMISHLNANREYIVQNNNDDDKTE